MNDKKKRVKYWSLLAYKINLSVNDERQLQNTYDIPTTNK